MMAKKNKILEKILPSKSAGDALHRTQKEILEKEPLYVPENIKLELLGFSNKCRNFFRGVNLLDSHFPEHDYLKAVNLEKHLIFPAHFDYHIETEHNTVEINPDGLLTVNLMNFLYNIETLLSPYYGERNNAKPILPVLVLMLPPLEKLKIDDEIISLAEHINHLKKSGQGGKIIPTQRQREYLNADLITKLCESCLFDYSDCIIDEKDKLRYWEDRIYNACLGNSSRNHTLFKVNNIILDSKVWGSYQKPINSGHQFTIVNENSGNIRIARSLFHVFQDKTLYQNIRNSYHNFFTGHTGENHDIDDNATIDAELIYRQLLNRDQKYDNPIYKDSWPDLKIYKNNCETAIIQFIPPGKTEEEVSLFILDLFNNLFPDNAQRFSRTCLEEIKKQIIFPNNYIFPNDNIMEFWATDLLATQLNSEGHILLYGETGSGKENTARIIHQLTFGLKSKAPYLPINCSEISPDLACSQIFGYRKGAFTDAKADTPGYIEKAENGTLFLDEIQTLPEEAINLLLRFMEYKKFGRLGEADNRKSADVRIIAATNDLNFIINPGLKEKGFSWRFKYNITVPPLRIRWRQLAYVLERYWNDNINNFEKARGCEISDNIRSKTIYPAKKEFVDNLSDKLHYGDKSLKGNFRELELEIRKTVDFILTRIYAENREAFKELPKKKGPKHRIEDEEFIKIIMSAIQSKENHTKILLDKIGKEYGTLRKLRRKLQTILMSGNTKYVNEIVEIRKALNKGGKLYDYPDPDFSR